MATDPRQAEPYLLFPEYFLHLADFPLYLPGDLLANAFGFQVGIVRRSSNLLFNSTFHLVKLSFCLVLNALLHGFSPFTRSICGSPLRNFNRRTSSESLFPARNRFKNKVLVVPFH